MNLLFWTREKKKVNPVILTGLDWHRQGDMMVAYPEKGSGVWDKYVVCPEAGGKFSVLRQMYRINARIGLYDSAEDAMLAAEDHYTDGKRV